MILSEKYQQELEMFANRLVKMYKHFSKWARKQGLNCFRIYDRDLPRFPFCIESYAEYLIVYEYKKDVQFKGVTHDQFLTDSLNSIEKSLQVPLSKIYYKVREKQSKGNQYNQISRETKRIEVTENSLKFWVNLSDYLDSGLFLDHRITRSMVKEKSYDKRVLNLFSYTGSFSVYAASGGASMVTTVDLSEPYLSIAKENFRLNHFYSDAYHFICTDVMQYIQTILPNSYDLIILDPPTFSRSKKMTRDFDIRRDHPELINTLIRKLSPKGELIFSTNSRGFVIRADQISGCTIKDITKQTIPKDFRDTEVHTCYLIQK
jgi:23S rRNA (cytosine1962-C5)-methyltransferase